MTIKSVKDENNVRKQSGTLILVVYFSRAMGKKRTNMFLSGSTELFSETNFATVVTPIGPWQRGRVKFQGTEWFARFYQSDTVLNAEPDTQVRVVGREGIALLIAPVNKVLVTA